jgi:hypothetical protein
MPEEFYKFATFALSAALAYDIRIARHNRKVNDRLVKENQHLIEHLRRLDKQATFLSDKLDEAGVEITEFDRIVFNNL